VETIALYSNIIDLVKVFNFLSEQFGTPM